MSMFQSPRCPRAPRARARLSLRPFDPSPQILQEANSSDSESSPANSSRTATETGPSWPSGPALSAASLAGKSGTIPTPLASPWVLLEAISLRLLCAGAGPGSGAGAGAGAGCWVSSTKSCETGDSRGAPRAAVARACSIVASKTTRASCSPRKLPRPSRASRNRKGRPPHPFLQLRSGLHR